MAKSIVSIQACTSYDRSSLRPALKACLEPLGGMRHFVHSGMRVLLKPNLLSSAPAEKSITTHPTLIRAVAELVIASGGTAWIGDSCAGTLKNDEQIWQTCGLAAIANELGAIHTPFASSIVKHLHGQDYLIARPILEADLVINLPKLKTHTLTLYTGAVKNLFGTIVGRRKRQLHLRAPGVNDFSRVLVDILELVQPQLNIMDGIVGLEGNGPGFAGTPHAFHCLAASSDPVALDATLAHAMGFRAGEILHLVQAEQRGLGVQKPGRIEIVGRPSVLRFGRRKLPRSHWYFNIPAWLSAPIHRQVKLRPHLDAGRCNGCGTCVEACPVHVITPGMPPRFDLKNCIGCLCCAEVCPQGAITSHRSLLAKLAGVE
jgi:uncharacterized protein (DUF362 family)/NAD-dependent dihydropyrimidine dehydrogenase PreA subunit